MRLFFLALNSVNYLFKQLIKDNMNAVQLVYIY